MTIREEPRFRTITYSKYEDEVRESGEDKRIIFNKKDNWYMKVRRYDYDGRDTNEDWYVDISNGKVYSKKDLFQYLSLCATNDYVSVPNYTEFYVV